MQEKQEETQQNCARGSCSKGFKTMCGGQALIEGIMMRGPKKESVVVRRPDGGLEIQERELRFIRDRYPVLGWPLIRGVVNFGGSMYSGVKALMYSAEFFPEDGEAEEEEPSKFEVWLESRLGSEKAASFFLTLAVILGVGMSIGLFFLLPTLLGTAVTLFTRLHAGAQRGGEPAEDRDFCGLSGTLLPDERHPPGVPVPRGGTQDYLLL